MTISITNISLASIQQKVIPEHLLARLTTIITSISAISLPMGSFIGGILIKNLGIDYTLCNWWSIIYYCKYHFLYIYTLQIIA